MLGQAVVAKLSGSGLSITATARDENHVFSAPTETRTFTVGDPVESVFGNLGIGDYVVNCVGLIKHHMNDSVSTDRIAAVHINSEFPYQLNALAMKRGFRVIQIATDCVFSGSVGAYVESSHHDAFDVYGKTKSLGEVPSPQFLNLRCSIIGEEAGGNTSLVGWLLSQTPRSEIRGFSDHIWNGVTTDVFANIVLGLINSKSELSGTYHLVPEDAADKSELSAAILRAFGRDDVVVIPTETGNPVNRTLSTNFPEVNRSIWALGGYGRPPRIGEMVKNLGR